MPTRRSPLSRLASAPTLGMFLGALALLIGGAALAGCESDPIETIGAGCQDGGDCEGYEQGFCANVGVCSARCATHEDCGCAEGTTNDDLQTGSCWARCVYDPDEDEGYCARTCGEDGDCEGATTCAFGPQDAVGSCL